MKHIARIGLGVALSMGFTVFAGAQAQQPSNDQNPPKPQAQAQTAAPQKTQPPSDSLGAYARHIKKDNGQAKEKPRIYDNDNIPREDQLSVIGPKPEGSTTDQNAQSANTEAENAPEKSAEQEQKEKEALWKQWQDKIAAQKNQIELLQRELDVLQREYQIRAAEFYADAGNRLRNQAAWDIQDKKYKEDIGVKTKAVEDAKQQLDDMQEEARKAGVPASKRDGD